MIGYEYRYADFARRFHAGDARHAIVHGDNQRRRTRGGECHDFRRQTIAEAKSIGNQEVDVRKMHAP